MQKPKVEELPLNMDVSMIGSTSTQWWAANTKDYAVFDTKLPF